jgi:hypothetical protein
MVYSFGYLLGLAFGDLVYTIPVYIAVVVAMRKVVKYKRLKIFSACFVIISILMVLAGRFTNADIVVLPVDIALCVWLGNKHYFDMHKGKTHLPK